MASFLPGLGLLFYTVSAFILNVFYVVDEKPTVLSKQFEEIRISNSCQSGDEREFWVEIGKIDSDCGIITSLSKDKEVKLVKKKCISLIENYIEKQ